MESAYHHERQDVLVTQWAGGLDEGTTMRFVDQMYKRMDGGLNRMVIDFSAVDYISSMEIGVLVMLHSRMKMKQGEIKLCSIKGIVPEVLRITQIDRVFDIRTNVESAVAAFPEEAGQMTL